MRGRDERGNDGLSAGSGSAGRRQLGPYFIAPNPIAQWMVEIGGRYWFSSGRTQKDLFGFAQSDGLLSRLTYTGLNAHTGEVFGRVEHVTGFLFKGFAGGGAITNGNLRDEDFAPFTFPYSSTNSRAARWTARLRDHRCRLDVEVRRHQVRIFHRV